MRPLAEELRPKSIDDIVGQDHLLEPGSVIKQSILSKKPLSMIFWGPPGCGKTSIARLYAKAFALPFYSLNATFSGVADIKKIVTEVKQTPLFQTSAVLFVDEVHRFNKSQQDAFLPFVEDGTLILIGATAENPSFYLNNALLSRMRVITLNSLNITDLNKLLTRYEAQFASLNLTEDARNELLHLAQGDGRYLFNLIENIQTLSGKEIDLETLMKIVQKRAPLFDKGDDQHYNLISALHKSVRGSDPDAALYWFARILEGGEEPLFLARRMIRMASEDIGLADPHALNLCVAARDAYQMLGSPEGELALAEALVYLALSPKSNAIYTAFGKAKQLAKQTSHLNPPAIILNAPTKLMKDLGYGKDYAYDHDEPNAFSGQNYFPDTVARQEFYHPVERGFERDLKKRKEYFEKLRKLSE